MPITMQVGFHIMLSLSYFGFEPERNMTIPRSDVFGYRGMLNCFYTHMLLGI